MRALSLLLATCALIAPPLWAQEQPTAEPSPTPTPMPASDDRTETEQAEGQRVFTDKIVVTASRREQASADTPAPITVIDREEIERRQPEKMADLLKEIPGVEISGEGPFRGLPVIRGFSSNRVLILVDGQRLNNARESTLFAGTQPGLVDMSQVERIEVLRGPASVQYGSDAIGGVINIITRKPDLGGETFTWSGDVGVEYSENADATRAHFGVSGTGRGFSLRFGASHTDVGDYVAPDEAATDERFSQYVLADGTVPNSGMEQTSFDSNLRWLVGEASVLRVGLEVVRTDDIGFPGFDPATSGVDIAFPRFDRDKLTASWDSGPLGALEGLTISTYAQQVVKESKRNLDFGVFYSNNFTRSDIDSYGLALQSGVQSGSHHLTFGLDAYRDDLEDTTLAESAFSPPSTEVAVPRSFQRGIGLWAQDDLHVSDHLKLVLGVRGDTFTFKSKSDPNYTGDAFDETDSAVSGNLGVIYAVTENVDLTGTIARGFRTPNIQERSFFGPATEPGFFIVQNPDLGPETSLNYEAGFKVRYDRYSGGLNLFYNDVSDFITFVEIGPDPDEPELELLQFANVEKATISGVELELESLVAERWTVFVNAAYLRGDNDTENQPLGFIPPFKSVAGARYQTPRWWIEGSARLVARTTRVPEGTDETPGFATLDLRGGVDVGHGLQLQATIANVLDRLYAEPFNNRPEPARSYRTSLRYRF
jgi:hemoglobin/transferrin/lactoferrin receptor protein